MTGTGIDVGARMGRGCAPGVATGGLNGAAGASGSGIGQLCDSVGVPLGRLADGGREVTDEVCLVGIA
jgi:hypothetical protein